jgi:cell division protein ZapA
VLVLTRAGQEVAAEIEALEQKFAAKLSDAAKALEDVAGTLDEAAPLAHS